MSAWPLVDEVEQRAQLTGAVFDKRGAVVTGPAGVGKTTLATTRLLRAEERGMSVARARAMHASRGLPFGALGSTLPPEPRDEDFSREDLGVLLGRYVRAVVEGARGRPLVVFVDDAHLLDNGSATLVHQLPDQGAHGAGHRCARWLGPSSTLPVPPIGSAGSLTFVTWPISTSEALDQQERTTRHALRDCR